MSDRENMYKSSVEQVVMGTDYLLGPEDTVVKKQIISECMLFILVKNKEKKCI